MHLNMPKSCKKKKKKEKKPTIFWSVDQFGSSRVKTKLIPTLELNGNITKMNVTSLMIDVSFKRLLLKNQF